MPISYDEYKKKYKAQIEQNNQKRREEYKRNISNITASKKKKKKDTWFNSGAFGDDEGNWFTDTLLSVASTVSDVGVGVVKGVGNMAEGIADLGSYGIAGIADAFGADDYAKQVKANAKKNYMDKWFDPLDNIVSKNSFLGEKSDNISEGLGYVSGMILTGGLGSSAGAAIGGTTKAAQIGATLATTGTTFSSSMGGGMSQAYNTMDQQVDNLKLQMNSTNDPEVRKKIQEKINEIEKDADGNAVKYGAIAGTAEAVTEMLFGGLGKAVNATGLSVGLSSADDMLAKKFSDLFEKQISKNIAEYGIKAAGEGLEEVLAGIAQAAGQKATYMSEEDMGQLIKDQNLWESFITGAIVSGIAQAPSLQKANVAGRDYVTNYTQNEQQVLDKEFENRVAQAEKDGQKLTTREKNAIKQDLQEQLEKGRITTDTIESVLGGDTYNQLKTQKDNKAKIENEIKELENKPFAELTVKEKERLDSIREELKKIDTNTLENQLQSEMTTKTASDGYLQRSYQEKANKGVKFEVDLTKYDEKQRSVVQKAIDSGILNNTSVTHEFVDFVAKVAGDKGIDFDFANNQKIKDSGFAIDGKTVNGFKNGNSVTLNVESNKALNRVVGHEITHVLEGTELYKELKTALKEYATTKGEYDTRFAEVSKIYENVKGADVESELMADLVGDYLFTDTDFINNLSTKKPNIFKKIYDEIKHLYKLATAGSKEARQLEKVKKAFDKAYKQNVKTTDADTKYAVSDGKIQGLEGYSVDEIKQLSREYIREKLIENDLSDVEIKDIAIHGSRGRGTAKADSDLDVVVEFEGDIREDDLFSLLNEDPMFIEDIQVDINPITESLTDYMARSDVYDKEVLSKQDAKYSLSDAGTHGTLIAIHNLTESKLNGILDLGGLPVPSIAISSEDTVSGNKNFGDYALLFDKDTIDPSNSKNKVYSRDAYTARFPQVTYKLNDAGIEALSKVSGESITSIENNLEGKTPSQAADYFRRNSVVLDGFLKQNNLTVNDVYKEVGYNYTFSTEEVVKEFIKNNDISFEKLLNDTELRNKFYELYRETTPDVLKDFTERKIETFEKAFANNNVNIASRLDSDFNAIKNGAGQQLDEISTRAEKLKVANENGYEKYLNELVAPAFGEKYLRNNVEELTPSGRRRSFEKLYDAFNLENVTKALTRKGDSGSESAFMHGINEIAGNASIRFKSIDDIRNNKNLLQSIDEAEYKNKLAEIEYTLAGIQDSIMDRGHSNSSNRFIAYDNLGELIGDHARDFGNNKKVTAEIIQKDLKEYGFNATIEETQKILDLFNEMRSLPTEYFEAKPQRAIGFDEVQVAVIPSTASQDIKQRLTENGINYVQYNPDVEGDYEAAINQFDDLKFSLSQQGQDIAPVRGDVFGSDIKLQVEEAIAPVQEAVTELSERLDTVVNASEQEIAPIKETDEYAPLTEADLPMMEQQWSEDFKQLAYEDIVPNEIENTTPEVEDTVTETKDLFATRDYAEVGNRKVKAYQYENPEVKPYFQDAARGMWADLAMSIKGERYVDAQVIYDTKGEAGVWGHKRMTTPDIADLLDGIDGKYKLSYAEIEKGLAAIIDDEGAENNAASKRIEFYLDQRLRNGYTTLDGYDIPANQEYLETIRGIEMDNYFRSIPFDDSMIPAEVVEEQYTPIKDVSNSQSIVPTGEIKVDQNGQGRIDLGINKLKGVDGEIVNKDVEPINIEKAKQLTLEGQEEDLVTKTRKQLRKALLGTESQKEFVLGALDNAKNRSMALMNNTDTIRNNELVFGRDAGRVINEIVFQPEIDNEARSVKWQNEQRQEIKDLGIKARSKESAAVQKYGEKQYVNEKGEVVKYGETELASEFKDVATQEKIKNAAKVIRSKYDAYIDDANKVLTKLGFDPIKKRNDYMRHFQELNDVFTRHGIPFNAQSMAEHTLPTDINGLTEFWSPQKNYFANMQPRKGIKTTYDAITGVDGYISGISNLIFHTEDIQRGRAFEELVRETYGEDKGWDNLESLPAELQQERAEKIQDNHLSNYAAWVHEWTNNVAGKKNKMDRAVEAVFGRKAFSFLDNTRKQVGANMIGFNLSSSLTNLIAPVQATAKTNKLAVLKGTADTIKNIFVKDNFMDKNNFLTSRMGTDMISQTSWQKMQNAGFVFMKGLDWFSSNQIVRSKYYELRAKGMSETQAHAEAGKFAARILGDRTKGANAQLYNSKLLGIVTQFQLEVNNQLYSMFYDTYHESKEAARANAAKTAAGMTFTLGQLFAFTHLFGQTFEAIAGYNPTFDIIGMLATALGWGDDDDDEKTTSERLKEAADQLVDALPYVNILTGGGRIPLASGIPNVVGVMTGAKDQYGNEMTWEDEFKKLLYLIPPTGGNQIKKTTQGLSMFDDELPVSGSYTDSGNLRFPVEETPENVLQAALFGQWANENAREYFNNERQPLKSKQIQEYADLDMPIADYWEYRDGLKKQNTIEEKFEYINGLDVSNEQKNIMINNVVDRKEEVDMTGYGDFGSYDEFDYATKNPDKYLIIEQIAPYDQYISYKENIAAIKEQFSTDNGYSTEQRKAAVQQYIESLPLDIPQKIMLEKMAGGYSVKSYRSYLEQYIESLPLTAEEKYTIDNQLFN